MRLLPLGGLLSLTAGGFYACNVYTEDLLGTQVATVPSTPMGGSDTAGGGPSSAGTAGASGNGAGAGGTSGDGNAGGAPSGGGADDAGSGGGSDNVGGSDANGGTDAGGGTSATGGTPDPGTGGTAGTGGGTAGAGGMAPMMPVTIIEDFATGTFNQITVTSGRGGFWFAFGQANATSLTDVGSAASFPECLAGLMGCANTDTGPPDFEPNLRAAHLVATGVTGDGAGFGFNFLQATDTPYDASAYIGVRFYARASTAGSGMVRVAFPSAATQLECGPAQPAPCCVSCSDHFGSDPQDFGTTWQPVELMFAALTQQAFGDPLPALDPTTVIGMQFQSGIGVTDLDFWVDQIEFILPP